MQVAAQRTRYWAFVVAIDSLVYMLALLTLAFSVVEVIWRILSPLTLTFVATGVFREFRRTASGYFFFLRLLLIFLPLVQLSVLGPTNAFDVLSHTQNLFDLYGHEAVTLIVSFYLFLEIGRTLLGIERKSARIESDILAAAKLETSPLQQYALAVISLAALFIYQPSLPGQAYSAFVNNILPGAGWNYVCLIPFGVLLMSDRRTVAATITVWLVPIWLLLHYDRGELLGVMIFYYLSRRAIGKSLSIRETAAGLALILSFVIIGAIRNEPTFQSFGQIGSEDILGNKTIQDFTHNLLAAIAYFDIYGSFRTVLATIEYLVPSYFVSERPMTAEVVLFTKMTTHRGMHWIGETYVNAGYWGAAAGALLTSLMVPALMFLIRKFDDKVLSSLVIFHIFLSLPRFCWYGIIYFLKPLILVVPVVWLIIRLTAPRKRPLND